MLMFPTGWLQLAAMATVAVAVAGPNAQSLPFNNTRSYGPDGPWHFITLEIGQLDQYVDFYPILGPVSSLLQAKSMLNGSVDPALDPAPSTYDTSQSASAQTVAGLDQSWVRAVDWIQTPGVAFGSQNITGGGTWWLDSVQKPFLAANTSFYAGQNVTITAPGGQSYKPLSFLSLAAKNQTQPVKNAKPPYNWEYSVLQSFAAQNPSTSSAFGMHIGSPTFNQNASLYLGGYDQSRLIEPPFTFQLNNQTSIKSISFGTSSGLSPFDPTLDQGAATPPANFLSAPLQAYVSPSTPYMHLPRAVCDAMAQYLPISRNDALGVYTWDSNMPFYKNVINSPSYINFTFSDAASTSIRVPFALLNLSLTAPLVDHPTPYFPCSPSDDTNVLGRAFLQAAFLAQSNDNQTTVLGQAPGPKAGAANVVALATNGTFAPASNASKWQDTWAGVLTPLTASNATAGNSEGPDASAQAAQANAATTLPVGAIVGACLGGACLIIFLAGGAMVLLYRRKRAQLIRNNFPPGAAQASHGVHEMNGWRGPLSPGTEAGATVVGPGAAAAAAAGKRYQFDVPPPPIPNEPIEIMDKHYSQQFGKFKTVQWGPLNS